MNFNGAAVGQAVLGYAANALWQVPLIFAAAWAAARMARRNGPAAEHRVWVAAILLEAVIPACHSDVGGALRGLLGTVFPAVGADGGAIRVAMGVGAAQRISGLRLPAEVFALVAILFAGSLTYFLARLGCGVWRTAAVRRRARPVLLEGDAAEVWRRLSGSRRMTEIAETREVPGPITVGVLRPAVLVPVGFLDTLRREDLEAVLAHELAHVRRWDFAKNLLYEAATLGLAWHPVVWLTRARMAESRELVCDAMAADAVAGRERYARSLLRLAALVSDGTPAKTLHAIGIFDANSFERRVMNLTVKPVAMKKVQRIAIAAACAVMVLATCATAMALRVEIGPGAAAVVAKGGGGGAENKKVQPGDVKIVSRVDPVYPRVARANKDTINGTVVLAVTIGKDGAVEEIHVEKSLREDYDKSAVEAVKTWRWEPYLLNGEPTEVDTKVEVNYMIY